jgi:hypothetical protein
MAGNSEEGQGPQRAVVPMMMMMMMMMKMKAEFYAARRYPPKNHTVSQPR